MKGKDIKERGNKLNNGKYSYDIKDDDNISTKEKIPIICPEHGMFMQKLDNHFAGKGCAKCKGGVKYTLEIFVEKATKKFNGKYTYPRAIYINSGTLIIITCSIHGDFKQLPENHLQGQGCPKCGRMKTNEEAIQEFIEIYGDEFDYSQTKYKGAFEKIDVICKIHGLFKVVSYYHLKRSKCPDCEKEEDRRKREKHFQEQATELYKGKYLYPDGYYIDCYDKIPIICLEHGVFYQYPMAHLHGHSCSGCNGGIRFTLEMAIEKSKEKHGKYTYDHITEYSNMRTLVSITCPIHGDFPQTFGAHLQGQGCPKCAGQNLTTEEYIVKVIENQGGKYSYPRTVYKGMKENIIVTCPIHGDFEQNAYYHLTGGGNCSKCSSNKSIVSQEYFDYLSNPNIIREHKLIANGVKYKVDGYDPITNIAYEFDGDLWHSNPEIYDLETMHPKTGVLHAEMYARTLNKKIDLEKAGYIVISIWEKDFKELQDKLRKENKKDDNKK